MDEVKAKAYQNLRYRIITHDLRPGQPLNEKELMARYKIGRTPLREVLTRLQSDGLIQRFPRSGTFVTPMDIHVFKEVIEIRKNLEAFAAQLAAKRITEEQLDTLAQILQKGDELANGDGKSLDSLMQSEFDFHNTLYEATNNQKLKDILYELHGVTARFWYSLVFSKQELLDQFNSLRQVFDALVEKDGIKAGEALEKHIQDFLDQAKDKIL